MMDSTQILVVLLFLVACICDVSSQTLRAGGSGRALVLQNDEFVSMTLPATASAASTQFSIATWIRMPMCHASGSIKARFAFFDSSKPLTSFYISSSCDPEYASVHDEFGVVANSSSSISQSIVRTTRWQNGTCNTTTITNSGSSSSACVADRVLFANAKPVWTHVAVVVDQSNTLTVFKNGTVYFSVPQFWSSSFTSMSPGGSFELRNVYQCKGGCYDRTPQNSHFQVDDTVVLNVALNGSTIQNIMTSGASAFASNMVVSWSYDETAKSSAASSPVRTSSTTGAVSSPFAHYFVNATGDRLIQLPSVGSSSVTYSLVQLPRYGVLFQASNTGAPLNNSIASTTGALGNSKGFVIYRANASFTASVLNDTFQYSVSDGVNTASGSVVLELNAAPTVVSLSAYHTNNSAVPGIVLSFGVSDANFEDLTCTVTSLPAKGTLFTTVDGITKGSAITQGQSMDCTNVYYVLPNPIGSLSLLQPYASFGYTVKDSFATAATPTSRIVVVPPLTAVGGPGTSLVVQPNDVLTSAPFGVSASGFSFLTWLRMPMCSVGATLSTRFGFKDSSDVDVFSIQIDSICGDSYASIRDQITVTAFNGASSTRTVSTTFGAALTTTVQVVEDGAVTSITTATSRTLIGNSKWAHLAVTMQPNGVVRTYLNGLPMPSGSGLLDRAVGLAVISPSNRFYATVKSTCTPSAYSCYEIAASRTQVQLGDIGVFNTALESAADIQKARSIGAASVPASNVVFWYSQDDADLSVASLVGDAGSLSLASGASTPIRPVGFYGSYGSSFVELLAGRNSLIVISLLSTVYPLPAAGWITFNITSLPSSGTLYQFTDAGRGVQITAAGSVVTHSSGKIYYQGSATFSSDQFSYTASNNATVLLSQVRLVSAAPPSALDLNVYRPYGTQLVTVGLLSQGSFTDLQCQLTSLPAKATLFTTTDSVLPASQLSIVDVNSTYFPCTTLIVQPDDGVGNYSTPFTQFSFKVCDAALSCSASASVRLFIVPALGQAGGAGQAIVLQPGDFIGSSPFVAASSRLTFASWLRIPLCHTPATAGVSVSFMDPSSHVLFGLAISSSCAKDYSSVSEEFSLLSASAKRYTAVTSYDQTGNATFSTYVDSVLTRQVFNAPSRLQWASADSSQWVHLAVTLDAVKGEVMIYKNGVLFDSLPAGFWRSTAVQQDGTFSMYNIYRCVEPCANNDRFSPSSVLLDATAVWSVVLSNTSINNLMPFGSTGLNEGLMVFWEYEEAGNGLNGLGTSGSGYAVSTMTDSAPRVPSSAPYFGSGYALRLAKPNQPLNIILAESVFPTPAANALYFNITRLPTMGTLTQANGDAISSVNVQVSDSLGSVRYVANANLIAGAVDSFAYTAWLGVLTVVGEVRIVLNQDPTAQPVLVIRESTTPHFITNLGGLDADFEPLSYVIDQLPAVGTLYRTVDGIVKGDPVTQQDVTNRVPLNCSRLLYTPVPGEFSASVSTPYINVTYSAVDALASASAVSSFAVIVMPSLRMVGGPGTSLVLPPMTWVFSDPFPALSSNEQQGFTVASWLKIPSCHAGSTVRTRMSMLNSTHITNRISELFAVSINQHCGFKYQDMNEEFEIRNAEGVSWIQRNAWASDGVLNTSATYGGNETYFAQSTTGPRTNWTSNVGTWVHVAAVANVTDGTVTIYRNGKLFGTSPMGMLSASPIHADAAFAVESLYRCQSDCFDSVLQNTHSQADETLLYTVALTADEVANVFKTSAVNVTRAQPLLYWQYDEVGSVVGSSGSSVLKGYLNRTATAPDWGFARAVSGAPVVVGAFTQVYTLATNVSRVISLANTTLPTPPPAFFSYRITRSLTHGRLFQVNPDGSVGNPIVSNDLVTDPQGRVIAFTMLALDDSFDYYVDNMVSTKFSTVRLTIQTPVRLQSLDVVRVENSTNIVAQPFASSYQWEDVSYQITALPSKGTLYCAVDTIIKDFEITPALAAAGPVSCSRFIYDPVQGDFSKPGIVYASFHFVAVQSTGQTSANASVNYYISFVPSPYVLKNTETFMAEDELRLIELSVENRDQKPIFAKIVLAPFAGQAYAVNEADDSVGYSLSAAAPLLQQWVESVSSYSSTRVIGSSAGAAPVIGHRDVFSYGDNQHAWGPSQEDNEAEFLELKFATPVYATGIEVYESFHGGAVYKISARRPDGSFQVLYEGVPRTWVKDYTIFAPEICTTNFMTDTIRVDLASNPATGGVAGRPEIDAVSLFGYPSLQNTIVSDSQNRLRFYYQPARFQEALNNDTFSFEVGDMCNLMHLHREISHPVLNVSVGIEGRTDPAVMMNLVNGFFQGDNGAFDIRATDHSGASELTFTIRSLPSAGKLYSDASFALPVSVGDQFVAPLSSSGAKQTLYYTVAPGARLDAFNVSVSNGLVDALPSSVSLKTLQCIRGYYLSTLSSREGQCTPCSAGETSEFDTDTLEGRCVLCPAGSYSPSAGTPQCLGCPAGQYQTEVGTTSCKPCEPGYFSPGAASATCLPCPAGSFASGYGTVQCPLCDVASYQDKPAQTFCRSCPERTYALVSGAQDYYQCVCKPGFFTPFNSSDATTCIVCPRGGVCQGDFHVPVAAAGYWNPATNPYEFFDCYIHGNCPGGAAEACNGGTTGEMCATCADGYYKLSGECRSCPKADGTGIPVVIAWIVFPFLLIIMYYAVNVRTEDSMFFSKSLNVNVYLFLSFVQVICLYRMFNVNWPYQVKRRLNDLSFFNLNFETLKPDCAFPSSFTSRYVFKMFFPLIMLMFYVVIYLCSMTFNAYFKDMHKRLLRKYGREDEEDQQHRESFTAAVVPLDAEGNIVGDSGAPKRYVFRWNDPHAWTELGRNMMLDMVFALTRPWDWNRLVNTVVWWLDVMYMYLAVACLSIYQCYPQPNGTYSLVSNPSTECYGSEWGSLLPLSIIFILFYLCGSFAFCAYLAYEALYSYFNNREFRIRYISILGKFRTNMWWWNLVMFLRKVVIAMSVTLPAYNGWVQGMLCIFFLVVALIFQVKFWPWYHWKANVLDIICLFFEIWLAAMSFFFIDSNVLSSQTSKTLADVYNLTEAIIFLGVFTCVAFWLHDLFEYIAPVFWPHRWGVHRDLSLDERARMARLMTTLKILTSDGMEHRLADWFHAANSYEQSMLTDFLNSMDENVLLEKKYIRVKEQTDDEVLKREAALRKAREPKPVLLKNAIQAPTAFDIGEDSDVEDKDAAGAVSVLLSPAPDVTPSRQRTSSSHSDADAHFINREGSFSFLQHQELELSDLHVDDPQPQEQAGGNSTFEASMSRDDPYA
eukprot:GILJ01006218.1.p1 GENE.GILJ01006218.1~~GILJ01006218.1.p1  ORF type:complete len:3271 (-),score=422.50 GILJ01006218.1:185-9997(-)